MWTWCSMYVQCSVYADSAVLLNSLLQFLEPVQPAALIKQNIERRLHCHFIWREMADADAVVDDDECRERERERERERSWQLEWCRGNSAHQCFTRGTNVAAASAAERSTLTTLQTQVIDSAALVQSLLLHWTDRSDDCDYNCVARHVRSVKHRRRTFSCGRLSWLNCQLSSAR